MKGKLLKDRRADEDGALSPANAPPAPLACSMQGAPQGEKTEWGRFW